MPWEVMADGGQSQLPPFFSIAEQAGLACKVERVDAARNLWRLTVEDDKAFAQACDWDGVKCAPCTYDAKARTCSRAVLV